MTATDRRRLFLALVLLAGLLLPLVATTPTAARPAPDIVLLITDDMRTSDWDVLTGSQQVIGGTLYPNYIYGTPLCCPNRATMLTGEYAHNHGVHDNKKGWQHFRPHEDRTIATALDAAGYHTALFGKYLNDYNNRTVPPGWDTWVNDKQGRTEKDLYVWGDQYHTDELRDRVLDFLETPPEDPLLLYLSFRAPHDPAVPANRHRNADVSPVSSGLDRNRRRTLLAVDEAVVAIAHAMGPRWDDACVFFVSDNGYVIKEHGKTGKNIWWDDASRTPMLARCPDLGRADQIISSTDLAPTILAAAGITPSWVMDGRAMQGGGSREGVLVESWSTHHPFTGIKGDGWLYVEPAGKHPLYYLLADDETTDHLAEVSDAEQQRLAGWLAALRDCAGVTCLAPPGDVTATARAERNPRHHRPRQRDGA
jgi:arylsulfatase A-like enzyme